MARYLILTITILFMTLFFQNCGETELQRPVRLSSTDYSGSFCPYDTANPSYRFRLVRFGMINLNAAPDEGQLRVDSDQDGLVDNKEVSPTYSPIKARSNNRVLDGICQQLGSCPTNPTCSPSVIFGLSGCDRANFNLTEDRFDYDGDSLPDFIEILRKTSPNSSNINSNVDGDNLPDIEEVLIGRDPNKSDNDYRPERTLAYSVSQNGTCSPVAGSLYPKYDFSSDQLFTVQTTTYSAPAGETPNLSHTEQENNLLIFYIVETVNQSPKKRQLWVAIEKLNAPSISAPVSFTKWGEQ